MSELIASLFYQHGFELLIAAAIAAAVIIGTFLLLGLRRPFDFQVRIGKSLVNFCSHGGDKHNGKQ